MTEYDNTNRGVMFKAREKKSAKGPDYTGKLDVNGSPYELAAWIKHDKHNQPFLSIKISVNDRPKTFHEKVKEVENEQIPF